MGKRVSELKKRNRRRQESAVLFMMPSLLGVFVFFILPFSVVIYYAFVDSPITGNFVAFDNFIRVFGNAAFKLAGKNTLVFSFVSMPLAVIISLILAAMLDRNIPFRSQFRTSFLTPMMVPVASVVLIVRVMFDFNGAVNNLLGGFGVAKIDWLKSDYAQVIIIFLFLWKNLGYNMILFLAALESIPRDILEVAHMENANAWQIFWMIKIRYLSPTILFVTILSLINSFKVFREIYLLTDNYPYEPLYMMQHFMNNAFGRLEYQKLSAGAIIMSLVMIVIIGALFLVENHFGKDVEE